MKTKNTPRPRRRLRRAAAQRTSRQATTYRLDPRLQEGLALLGKMHKVSANQMVNEAVTEYLDSRTAAVEIDLQETLRRVRAYRQADPNFESGIADFAEAEASLAEEDPVEGTPVAAARRSQTLVRELIRG